MINPPIILLVIKSLEGRGAQRAVTILARAFVELGTQAHVLCLEDDLELPLDERVHYHVLGYDPAKLPADFDQTAPYQEVADKIDRYVIANIGQPDLILVNIHKLNRAMAYSQLPNIVNILHTALSRQFATQLAESPEEAITHLKMIYGAHPCSCVSEGARQDLQSLIGNSTKTATIYNPCNVDEIAQAAAQPFYLDNFYLDSFALVAKDYLIHVGSFDAMKGHAELLEAYSLTSRQMPLVLVGKGRLEAEIKALAMALGIRDKVLFVGYQANPYPLIQQAAFMVLASKFEGFGYVIVEAQALEVPVISTDCPFGPRELLPAQNLVPVNDVEGLAGLLERAMAAPMDFYAPLNSGLLPQAIAKQYLQFADVTL